MGTAVAPPLPPGFVLDKQESTAPPLPPGFVLDSPTGEAPKQEAPEQPRTWLDDAGDFAKGAWSQLNPVTAVKGMAQAAAHPIDTATNMLSAQGGLASKAEEAFKAGDYGTGARHVIEYLLPVLGPAVSQMGDKAAEGKVAEALGEATGLAGVMASPGASGKVAGAVKRVAGRAAPALEASAEAGMSRVLNAKGKANQLRSEKVVPELIRRGEMHASLKGFNEQAAAKLQEFGQKLDDKYATLPADAAVPLDSITNSIKSQADEAFKVQGLAMDKYAETGLAHADDLAGRLASVATKDPVTGQNVISVGTVRRLRQYYDKVAAHAGRFDGVSLADHSAASASGMAADGIRAELAKQFPDVAVLNKEYSFWKDVDRITGDTLLSRKGKAAPLGRTIAAAAGAAGGFAHSGPLGAVVGKVAMGWIEQAVNSAGWQSVSAVTKDRLAKALAAGERGKIELYARRAAQAARAGVVVRMPAQSASVEVPRLVAQNEDRQ